MNHLPKVITNLGSRLEGSLNILGEVLRTKDEETGRKGFTKRLQLAFVTINHEDTRLDSRRQLRANPVEEAQE
jgi:hypothetical protein